MSSEWLDITGSGVVSAAGLERSAFDAAIVAGRGFIAPIEGVTPKAKVRFVAGAPIRDFVAAAYFDDKVAAGLDRFSQFAVVAARGAVAEAGFDLAACGYAPERVGVLIGTANAGVDILDEGFNRFLLQSLKPLPLTVPMTMGSAPASRIAREVGAMGPVFGVTSACASAAHAIITGAQFIRAGLADAMIVGGADSCFAEGYLRAWDGLRAVSPDTCRPFSRDRKGLIIGEGAGVFILERAGRAAARGVKTRARLAGVGMGCDAGELTVPDEAGMARAMLAAIADAGLRPEDVDYVNAHGTGTQVNDRLEAAAIRRVFGSRSVPASSTKSAIGHAMGASGALELLATLAGMDASIAPPTLNFLGPDPACDIDPTPNSPKPMTINVALSNSFAFGSLNATLLVASPAVTVRA